MVKSPKNFILENPLLGTTQDGDIKEFVSRDELLQYMQLYGAHIESAVRSIRIKSEDPDLFINDAFIRNKLDRDYYEDYMQKLVWEEED